MVPIWIFGGILAIGLVQIAIILAIEYQEYIYGFLALAGMFLLFAFICSLMGLTAFEITLVLLLSGLLISRVRFF